MGRLKSLTGKKDEIVSIGNTDEILVRLTNIMTRSRALRRGTRGSYGFQVS